MKNHSINYLPVITDTNKSNHESVWTKSQKETK